MLDLYKNIKSRRIELGLTQQKLAELVGYKGKSMIAQIEKGSVDLSSTMITKFAEALKTTESDLLGWNDTQDDDRCNHFTKEDEDIVADFITDKIKNKYIRLLYETLGDITEAEGEELIRYAEFIKSKRPKNIMDIKTDNVTIELYERK